MTLTMKLRLALVFALVLGAPFALAQVYPGPSNSSVEGVENPPNDPPVWNNDPSPVFNVDTAASYDLLQDASDQDDDALTFVNETGCTLPTGVTIDNVNKELDYAGTGSTGETTGCVFSADDGTASPVNSGAFSIVINDWPAYGAHVQGSANVAGIDITLSDPLFSDWQRKKDLIYLQGMYPTSSRVQSTYAGVQSMRTDNANLRVLEYVYPQRTDNALQDILLLSWEAVEENSGETKWRGVDVDSSSLIYDNQGRIFLNTNYEGTDPSNGKTTFIDALWDKMQVKSGTGAAVDLRAELDGVFLDSSDYQDNFPAQKESDGSTSANIDYLKPKSSGSTDPVYYRDGVKYGVAQFRTEFGSDQAWSSNGGRDGTAVNETTANNEWAGFWDHRLSENVQWEIGLEKKTGLNELETTFSTNQLAIRIDDLFRKFLVSAEMLDRTATNRLGKGMVQVDYVFEWSGVDPTSVSDIPQDYYEAARFICGLALLDDKFMCGPNLERGTLPFPYMDEFVYDPGDPVGGTPSIGTIDNTDSELPFTIRAADDGEFYWQEYDNVLWVVNLNTPDGLSDWPQAATDTVTLPDPGVGKVWRYADCAYVNTSRTTGATAAESQSCAVNDGSLTGATIAMPRWHARMLVRDDE